MQDVCYLCGLPIKSQQERSDDHVIPETLIKRDQPKVKGFDYGHSLPTHAKCNNEFGPETYASKALDLLGVLNSPSQSRPLQHRKDPSITILPVNASKLSHFTKRDVAYFKLIDARKLDGSEISDPAFFSRYERTNPGQQALQIAVSVLAKSAAALLVKRHLKSIPTVWRIYAQVYSGDLSDLDLTPLLGENRPFDKELRAWVVGFPDGNWHVLFAAQETPIFLTFAFNNRRRILHEARAAHVGATTLKFLGTNLNELLFCRWPEV